MKNRSKTWSLSSSNHGGGKDKGSLDEEAKAKYGMAFSRVRVPSRRACADHIVKIVVMGMLSMQFLFFFFSIAREVQCGGVKVEFDVDGTQTTTPTWLPSIQENGQPNNNGTMSLMLNLQLQQQQQQIPGDWGIQPRVFPKWTHPFPCFLSNETWWDPSVQKTPARTGFFFSKEMKTGSSTCAGVHLRISKIMAMKMQQQQQQQQQLQYPHYSCRVRFDHALASQLEYGKRSQRHSFLWTMVRDPTHRAISQFFHFGVSRDKREPTDSVFQTYLQKSVFEHYYLKSLSMESRMFRKKKINLERTVNAILQSYNFIGITERLEESLVVLSLVLNLSLTDVLYLGASKGQGGFDDGRDRQQCVYIVPSFVSPGMKKYFASGEWKQRIVGDEYLYQVANQSLDRTVDMLGREYVAQTLKQYRTLRRLAETACDTKVNWPCSAGGHHDPRASGCLWQDSGCGNACLDEVVELWTRQQGAQDAMGTNMTLSQKLL